MLLLCSYYDGVLRSFFFFKQKTAYEMRISDWSSDVCSSDLASIDRLNGLTLFSEGDEARVCCSVADRPALCIFGSSIWLSITRMSPAGVAGLQAPTTMEQTSRFKIFRLAFSRTRRTGHDVESPSATRFWIFAPRRNGGFCVNLRHRRSWATNRMRFVPW